jgi:Fe-S cluster biogenesis protein NfuA
MDGRSQYHRRVGRPPPKGGSLQPLRARLQETIDEVLRPLIEADGGAIELLVVEERRVVVALRGACHGCPGSQFTQRHVIEPALRAAAGGVDLEVEVRTVAATREATATASCR